MITSFIIHKTGRHYWWANNWT